MDILIKNIGGLPEDGDLTLTITPKGEIILGGCIFTHNFGKEVKAVALPPHGDLKDMTDIWDTIHRFFHGDCFEVCKLIRKFCPTIVEANYGTDN